MIDFYPSADNQKAIVELFAIEQVYCQCGCDLPAFKTLIGSFLNRYHNHASKIEFALKRNQLDVIATHAERLRQDSQHLNCESFDLALQNLIRDCASSKTNSVNKSWQEVERHATTLVEMVRKFTYSQRQKATLRKLF